MSNVVSLTSHRIARQCEQAAYADGKPVDLDWSDVVRMSNRDEHGEFIDDLGDPVQLGARATMQVRRLFWGVGLQRMPATWGELLGNWNYARLVPMWLMRYDPKHDMRASATKEHNSRCPGRGDALLCLAVANTEGAWRIHQQHGTFDANARDPLLTKTK